MKKVSIVLAILFVSFGISQGQSGLKYEAVRINNGQPIITQNMFTSVGAHNEGENLNGPSVIRIPDWIEPENRADPEALYYLYFAHHDGAYIRMAWAKEIEGPWYLYNIGSAVLVGNRGVLDLGGSQIHIDNGISIPNNHLASPDAIVDHENQQIILYFHSGSSTYVDGVEVDKQICYVATSPYGLNFYNHIESVLLGPSYFRVFNYKQNLYALTNDGTPYRAPDVESPWTPPGGHDFTKYLWNKHPENPFQLDINNDGYSRDVLRVRHTAVRLVGDDLHIFYSRRGDSPERIQMSVIDLKVSNWEQWDATYPPIEILKAVPGWEGGELSLKPSDKGPAPENVNQLRDPYFFEDNDGSMYLFYTGRGEDAIGITALYYHETFPAGYDITDLEGTVITGSNDDEPWIGPGEGAGSPPGEEVSKLIDNDNLTKYTVRDEASWIEIAPTRYSTITGYAVTFADDYPERDPKLWELQGWDESAGEWIGMHAIVNYPVRETRFQKKSWSVNNEKSYSRYRLNITAISGDPQGLMQLAELQLIGEIGDPVAVLSDDATLSALTVDSFNLIPEFNAAALLYTVEDLPEGTTSVTVIATANDSDATVAGHGFIDVSSGTGTANVVVTAEDGSSQTYTVNIHVLTSVLNPNDVGKVNFYYDPVGDFIRITNSDDVEMVEIFSITGQLLMNVMANNRGSIEISTNVIPQGVYIVRMKLSSDKTKGAKFLK